MKLENCYSANSKKKRRSLVDEIPLAKPFTIAIDPSSFCNFKCKNCFHGYDHLDCKIKKHFMSVSTFRKIIDDIVTWQGEPIKLLRLYNAGEPMLNPHFCDMLRYLKGKKVADRIEITTNGSLMNEEIREALVDSGIDYVRVSIYAATDEQQQIITGNSKTSVDDIYKNVKALKELREERDKQTPFIYVKAFESLNDADKKLFQERYSPIADEVAFERLMDFNGEISAEMIGVDKSAVKSREVCPYVFYFMLINPDGTVGSCCVDFFEGINVGNVNSQTLKDIWNGSKLRDIQSIHVMRQRKKIPTCSLCEMFLSDDFIRDDMDSLTIAEYNERVKQ